MIFKNQYGFVPKRYKQPVKYEYIYNNWCAVYIHPKTRAEYHLELCGSVLSNWRYAEHLQVLRKDTDCRLPLETNLKTIRAGIEVIEKIFETEMSN